MASSCTKRIHFQNLSQNPQIDEELPRLPFDIVVEILSWLPVKSLLRFKCASKQWRSLALDSKFIALHMSRAKPSQPSTSLYDANFKYITGGAGLFLEESVASPTRVFRIRNFATHQVLYLPPLRDVAEGNKRFVMAFVLNSLTGECKVVACFNMMHENVACIRILSVGKDEDWRTLKLPKENYKGNYTIIHKGTIEDGVAQTAHINRDGRGLTVEIHTLDLWSECFTITKLPDNAFSDLNRIAGLDWNHNFALVDILDDSIHVWLLENFKEHKWRNFTVPFDFLKVTQLGARDQIRAWYVRSSFLVLKIMVEDNFIVCDMKTGRVRKVTREIIEKASNANPKPSLVTFKAMKNQD